MRSGRFDFGVLGAPFHLWRQFLAIFAATAFIAAIANFAIDQWSPAFQWDLYATGNLVLLATFIFDGLWLAVLKGIPLQSLPNLLRQRTFWKFLGLMVVLDGGLGYAIFALNYVSVDFQLPSGGFNTLYHWLSPFISGSLDQSDLLSANSFAYGAVATILTWVAFIWRALVALWPAFVMTTGRIGRSSEAMQLTTNAILDLMLVYAAVAVTLGIVGLIPVVVLPASSFATFLLIMLFACLFRAMINAIYFEHIAGMIEFGEIKVTSEGERQVSRSVK
jgi:hypothetical protein